MTGWLIFSAELLARRSRRDRLRRHRRWLVLLLALTGAGLATQYARVPRLTVAQRLDFAAEPIGTTSLEQMVVMGNAGHAPLNIQMVALAGSHPQDFLVDTADCTQAPVDPDNTCTVAVRFRPLAAGARLAEISVVHDGRNSPQIVLLSGAGFSAPPLVVRPAALLFRDQQVGTDSAPEAVTVTSDSDTRLQMAPVVIEQHQPGIFRIASDTCSNASVAAADSCTVEVRFTPRMAGANEGRLVVSPQSGESRTVELRGQGTAAPATVSIAANPARLDFGTQQIGTASSMQPTAVVNTGAAPLVIGQLAIEGPHATEFVKVRDDCSGKPLPVGEDGCPVKVRFAPRSAGPRSADLVVPSNAGHKPLRVALSGIGLNAPLRALAFDAPDFPPQPVGSQSQTKVTLRSIGNAPVRLGPSTIRQAGQEFRIGADSCSNRLLPPLAPQNFCEISIWFVPREARTYEASLVLEHDAPDAPRQVPLRATALISLMKRFEIAPASIKFEPQPAAGRRPAVTVARNERWLELRSRGTAPVEVGAISITGRNEADFQVDDRNGCAHKTLQAGCTLGVLFAPSGPGLRQAVLQIDHDAPDSPRAVPLTGVGLAEPAGCPDFMLRLNPTITARQSRYAGTVRLTGIVRNAGVVAYLSAPGRHQSLTLYDVLSGGQPRTIQVMPFTNLEPGQEMSLVYDINWSTTNQFPSSFRLEVVYEPDLNCPGNNAATLRPEAINQLFRSQTQVPGYEGIRPASKEPLRDEARPLEPAKVRPQLRTAATLDISGNWNSSIGATYKITQNGDRFNWGVRQFREQGSGRVTGARINANWEGERGTGRGNGRVIVDANANAVRIEWDNGVIFFR